MKRKTPIFCTEVCSMPVMFKGLIGPNGVGKFAFCDNRVNTEKICPNTQDYLFGGIKSMLG